jgi:SAM-dependent methyltransferase
MDKKLLQSLKLEQQFQFKGFDFSHLRHRMQDEPLPWSYVSSVIKAIRAAKAPVMLDIGTGGGEILSEMRPLPKKTFATESYKPNIKVARDKLAPLGVKVIVTKSEDELPFPDSYFDLVIDRHSAFKSKEVSRVLKKGGLFITQQVASNSNCYMQDLLGMKDVPWTKKDSLKFYTDELKRAKMKVIKAVEAYPKTRFYDTAAIVYYLKGVPWVIPDFSIKKYAKALERIDNKIDKKGYVEVGGHSVFFIAKKPEPSRPA